MMADQQTAPTSTAPAPLMVRQTPVPQPVLDALAAASEACKQWAPTEVREAPQLGEPREGEVCDILTLDLRPSQLAYQSGLITAGGAAFAGFFLLFMMWGAFRAYKRMSKKKTPAA